jgi:hypothetical protein
MAGTTPPPDATGLGFHHDTFLVELAVFGVEAWHVLPFAGGLFDQPESLIFDMVRWQNENRRVNDPDNPTLYTDPDAYEEQPDTEVKRLSL